MSCRFVDEKIWIVFDNVKESIKKNEVYDCKPLISLTMFFMIDVVKKQPFYNWAADQYTSRGKL